MSAQKEKTTTADSTTETMVADYLKTNPGFFDQHPDVLAAINITHQQAGTLSLLEKQVARLRQQNELAGQRLNELIENAQQNEALTQRVQKLVLALLMVEQPETVFKTLEENLKHEFHADCVAVRIFTESVMTEGVFDKVFVGQSTKEKTLFDPMFEKGLPLTGCMSYQQQAFLFGDDGDSITSSVMIPLNGKDWHGVLAIGSTDAARFKAGMSADLLTYFAGVLSLILQPWAAKA